MYLHINNDIEYGLFEDVISSYYLDSQIKDDFKCDHNCYTNTQQKQQDQPLTPCTHAYDHITQHINNLEDQHSNIYCTLRKWMHHYLQLILPHYVIIISLTKYQTQIHFQKTNKKLHNQLEFIHKANINTEMSLVTRTSNIMISAMVMHSLLKTNIQHYLLVFT